MVVYSLGPSDITSEDCSCFSREGCGKRIVYHSCCFKVRVYRDQRVLPRRQTIWYNVTNEKNKQHLQFHFKTQQILLLKLHFCLQILFVCKCFGCDKEGLHWSRISALRKGTKEVAYFQGNWLGLWEGTRHPCIVSPPRWSKHMYFWGPEIFRYYNSHP